MAVRKSNNPKLSREGLLDKYIKLERKLEITKSQRAVNKIVFELGKLEMLYGITTDEVMDRKKQLREKNPIDLYKSFHGNSPKGLRKVFYEEPTGKLIKIGRLSEIRYVAEEPSQHSNTEFYHKAGDLGHKVIKSNAILCTNEEGTQLYIVKEKKGKYPLFSERGILG